MLRFTPASSHPVPILANSGDPDAAALCDPLLDALGPVAGSHALVVCRSGLDLMCRLLRRGCAAVTTLQLGERHDHDTYDVVLVSSAVSTATAGLLVRQAKRALQPGGRFLAAVPAVSMMVNPSAPAMLVRLLRADGFVHAHTRATPDGVLVQAERPLGDAHHPSAIPWAQA